MNNHRQELESHGDERFNGKIREAEFDGFQRDIHDETNFIKKTTRTICFELTVVQDGVDHL